MKYLICQDWGNTANNHAGMKHMCHLLKKHYPNQYEVIVFPDLYKNVNFNTLHGKIKASFIRKFLIPARYKKIARHLLHVVKPGDAIYLLEYFEKLFPQVTLARQIRRVKKDVKISGLVHIVPQKINASFTKKEAMDWLAPLDEVLTLGSSLSQFFKTTYNILQKNIRTLFHYVDLEYYKPSSNYAHTQAPVIIALGNQKRNFDLLKKVVQHNPGCEFIICQGLANLSSHFKDCSNVVLKGFMDEEELLKVMQQSDISLNIMDDTIGSNVITTSMAVGLAIVASNVGSIKDYCKEDGAIYCNNSDVDSFSKAIKLLYSDGYYLNELKKKSLLYSQPLSIHHLHKVL